MKENKELDRYQETKQRMFAKYNNVYISDKQIIEDLAEEIEQYREEIDNQRRIIKELSKNNIQSEEVILDDELMDKDITEIISSTQYVDGKPIISKLEYKYKQNELPNELKKLENIQLC